MGENVLFDLEVLGPFLLVGLLVIGWRYRTYRWPFGDDRLFEPWAYDDLGDVPRVGDVVVYALDERETPKPDAITYPARRPTALTPIDGSDFGDCSAYRTLRDKGLLGSLTRKGS